MRAVRPRFELEVLESNEDVLERVRRKLHHRSRKMAGIVAENRIELHVPSERQHLWSPQLTVDVENTVRGSLLRGRFGPHPHVWALFVSVGAIAAFSCLVAVSFAYAQWTMGKSPSALWFTLVGVFVETALYGVVFLGQHLGADQVLELRGFLEEGLTRCTDIESSDQANELNAPVEPVVQTLPRT